MSEQIVPLTLPKPALLHKNKWQCMYILKWSTDYKWLLYFPSSCQFLANSFFILKSLVIPLLQFRFWALCLSTLLAGYGVDLVLWHGELVRTRMSMRIGSTTQLSQHNWTYLACTSSSLQVPIGQPPLPGHR